MKGKPETGNGAYEVVLGGLCELLLSSISEICIYDLVSTFISICWRMGGRDLGPKSTGEGGWERLGSATGYSPGLSEFVRTVLISGAPSAMFVEF